MTQATVFERVGSMAPADAVVGATEKSTSPTATSDRLILDTKPRSHCEQWSSVRMVAITQFFDEVGQPLTQVISDGDPAENDPAPNFWITGVLRDERGCVISVATPENCSEFVNEDGSYTANPNEGLIRHFTRETSDAAT